MSANESAQHTLTPRDSSAPLLGRDTENMSSTDAPASGNAGAETDSVAARNSDSQQSGSAVADSAKTGVRRLFGFGKKKEGDKSNRTGDAQQVSAQPATSTTPSASTTNAASGAGSTSQSENTLSPNRVASPSKPMESAGAAPHRPADLDLAGSAPRAHPQTHPYSVSMSPGQFRTSSPRMHSPASSQIFERSVQENTITSELSPAIPSHIQTEDFIPPVLEASSIAITDDKLDPDEVEIVTHSAHQPAAVTVTGTADSSMLMPAPSEHDDQMSGHHDHEETASNYGAIDTTDVRRLSFISFHDVVQAEHIESGRDGVHLTSLTSSTAAPSAARSPSPARSPLSSRGFGGPSPPTSGAPSFIGAEGSPTRKPRSPPLGSPAPAHSPPLGAHPGELQIETMRQALRKTGSGDLSGARSQPMSPVIDEAVENPLRR